MNADRVELTLLRAADDAAQFSEEDQAEVEAFDTDLRRKGLEVIAIAVASGPGILTGQFLVTLGPPFIAAIAAVAGAWVQARYGRRVRLKVGDTEVEARTLAEIEALLKRAAEFENKRHHSGDR